MTIPKRRKRKRTRKDEAKRWAHLEEQPQPRYRKPKPYGKETQADHRNGAKE